MCDRELTSIYKESQLRNALTRWVKTGADTNSENAEGEEELLEQALQGNRDLEAGLNEAAQVDVALRLHKEAAYQQYGLPSLHSAIKKLCKGKKAVISWNDKLQKQLEEILAAQVDKTKNVKDLLEIVQPDVRFKCFASKQLLPKIQNWVYKRDSGHENKLVW